MAIHGIKLAAETKPRSRQWLPTSARVLKRLANRTANRR